MAWTPCGVTSCSVPDPDCTDPARGEAAWMYLKIALSNCIWRCGPDACLSHPLPLSANLHPGAHRRRAARQRLVSLRRSPGDRTHLAGAHSPRPRGRRIRLFATAIGLSQAPPSSGRCGVPPSGGVVRTTAFRRSPPTAPCVTQGEPARARPRHRPQKLRQQRRTLAHDKPAGAVVGTPSQNAPKPRQRRWKHPPHAHLNSPPKRCPSP